MIGHLVPGSALTGGGSGIGNAIALAQAGAAVAIVDFLPGGGRNVANEIGRSERELLEGRRSRRRRGDPRTLAGADAGYITGQTLVIDGGWTAR